MATLVFEVEGLGLTTSAYNTPEYWQVKAELEKGRRWICGIAWDVTKADKPSGITPPTEIDYDVVCGATDVLKGANWCGNYYMISNSKEESQGKFKKLVTWVYDRRVSILEKSAQEFKDGREEFLKRQFKKVKSNG